MVILILAGGLLFFYSVTLLRLENMDRPKVMLVRIGPSERFSMFYIHSIYQEPVTEEFEAERGAITLKGVRTKSPAVLEYYGFEDTSEFHPMNQRLGAIFIMRRGMGEGQGLIVRDRKIYLSEIGEKGDRIQLRVESIHLWRYLLNQVT
jgi:hypothetical protein